MGLELGWTDQEIDALRPFRTEDGKTFRLQDQVTDAVIAHNASKRPMCFSLLANPSSRRFYGDQIDTLLEMRGMTYLLTNTVTKSGIRIPIETNNNLLIHSGKAKFNGWTDPTIYRDEMTDRSIAGVEDRFMAVVQTLLKEKRWSEATEVLQFVVDSVRRTPEGVETLLSTIAETGDTARIITMARRYPEADSLMLRHILARTQRLAGDKVAAEQTLLALLRDEPSNRSSLDELMKLYIGQNNVRGMINALETWMRNNPNDKEVAEALTELRKELEAKRPQGASAP